MSVSWYVLEYAPQSMPQTIRFGVPDWLARLVAARHSPSGILIATGRVNRSFPWLDSSLDWRSLSPALYSRPFRFHPEPRTKNSACEPSTDGRSDGPPPGALASGEADMIGSWIPRRARAPSAPRGPSQQFRLLDRSTTGTDSVDLVETGWTELHTSRRVRNSKTKTFTLTT